MHNFCAWDSLKVKTPGTCIYTI